MPRGFSGGFMPVLEISADDVVTVNPIDREDHQYREIRDQDCPIEPAELVDAGKSVVEQPTHQATRGGNRQQCKRQGQGHKWRPGLLEFRADRAARTAAENIIVACGLPLAVSEEIWPAPRGPCGGAAGRYFTSSIGSSSGES